MTSAKYIAGMIDREKQKAEAAKRLKENYARFMPKVKKESTGAGRDVD